MKFVYFALSAFLYALVFSCAPVQPSDETLLLYARSQNMYMEGRFTETAKMLRDEKRFVPALILRGKAEFLSGDSVAAEKSLKRALDLEKANADALIFLARLYREKGDTGGARSLSEKILANDPQNIRALRFAADLARERGAAGEAVSLAFLDRAIDASAELALVFLDRASLRWIAGNGSGALEDLSRARAFISRDSPVFRAIEKMEAVIYEVTR